MKKYHVLKQLESQKLVAVVRGETVNEALAISRACIKGGIKAVELTFTLKGAEEAIENLAKEYHDDQDVVVGAGTVLDASTARIAILKGAAFIVSPGFDKETALLCNTYHVPYLPGAVTVTEVQEALKYGVDVIKLFPGSLAGPKYIAALKGPLPHVNVMPTGGVDENNVKDWLKHGAFACGIGSNLTSLKKLGSLEAIEEQAKRYRARITG
ncbi:2-dehydro-3-deoxyphosphogluconate aldolase/(4S)-4-hydroxy-2-oxoglutarate aldolase [Natronobacillus azotifigens]|uniref:Bifunctional 2-keto-4-hydroxyglutarate aldolase/2-keto-3-deoxy-6-phosphogluconate aldolase n=1 Tax=Natronobacillus azotifigens TaxID=472978 RepID=A0A9J6RFX6_9BACI|nr:bifunctional 2-keto-4-hydroxyglutarate aldolase/2-keto-3-deoxy-6-phosphogluconate aldolase [Natronobacillus azotifigens]MCZ0704326.1 bifunctional 2-keto-4-hydroxyglutarate aldolase/2-keto-3-deoxy-6-phosphogluconate aldolase [Natronobacillus azotifigens]